MSDYREELFKQQSKTRYRKPKVYDDEIRLQMGKDEGIYDVMVYNGKEVPKCDVRLLFYVFCSQHFTPYSGEPMPSFIQELIDRGYDLDSMRFSIHKKRDLDE
jgi:hypothetical protein